MKRLFYKGFYTNKSVKNGGCYSKYKFTKAIFYKDFENDENLCYKYNKERSHELCAVCNKKCHNPEPTSSQHYSNKSYNKLKGKQKKAGKWYSYLTTI